VLSVFGSRLQRGVEVALQCEHLLPEGLDLADRVEDSELRREMGGETVSSGGERDKNELVGDV
jgi:hypothetical protein